MAEDKKKSSPEKNVFDKYMKDNPLFKGADKIQKHLKDKLEKKGKKKAKGYKKGGTVTKHRGDGCVIKGRTKGRMV